MNNDRQEIEELIKEFVNLNPISDEANNFAKNKLTSDFFLIRNTGEIVSLIQSEVLGDFNFDVIFKKFDEIKKIKISPDANLAFISFSFICKFKMKGFWRSEQLTLNFCSGYVTKEDNIWKIGMIQTTQKELKSLI